MTPFDSGRADGGGGGAWPVRAGFLWGLAEGAFFFIVPDVLITWNALFDIRKSLRVMTAVLAGSLLAGAGMYFWAQARPARAIGIVKRVPFVRQRMFATAEADLRKHGAVALLQGPMSGIPYKIYAVLAPPHCSFAAFLLISAPARLERLVLSWGLFAVVRRLFRRTLDAHRGAALCFHGLYWTITYAIYWFWV